MIGPKGNTDWWPRIVMLKALTQYHDLTDDPRVIPVMTLYLQHQFHALKEHPWTDWSRFRWQDELLSVIWLYNRTGDAQLLELARLLKAQAAD
jgi:beta-L-arabinofuranosidase (glycosyl hydrolase family 127)